MRSDKPEAREFQDWVTRKVLPAIRKDGMYVAGEEKVKTGEMSDFSVAYGKFQRSAAPEQQSKRFRLCHDFSLERPNSHQWWKPLEF